MGGAFASSSAYTCSFTCANGLALNSSASRLNATMLQCSAPAAVGHVACASLVQVREEAAGTAGGSFVAGGSLVFEYLCAWLALDQESGPSSGGTTLHLQVKNNLWD
jgi:hypothetical protein